MTGPQPILPISRPNEQQDDADFSLETETLVGTDHSPENRPSLGITGPVSAILDPNFCLLTVSEVSKYISAGKTPWIADHLKFVVIITLVVYSSIHSSPQYPDLSEWAACNMPLGVLNSLWLVNMTYVPLAVVWVLRYLFPTKESCVFSGTFMSPRGVLTLFQETPSYLICSRLYLVHCRPFLRLLVV